jgi:methylenetetrahydrofolate--tRNA-(uracil-5-)-methyltransferase
LQIDIIGAGFAGVEAAYFLSLRGFKVNLYEMRPYKLTPVHKTGDFAELVCSNSFKSMDTANAHGLLKKELEICGSLIIREAYKCAVPAGQSLSVDRDKFSSNITSTIKNEKNINIINKEIISLDEWKDNKNKNLIIATGPMTSDLMHECIKSLTGSDSLFFFDAAAPIVDASTIDYNRVFFQSRYCKGGADYLNAPFTKEEYLNFVDEIIKAEKIIPKDFETNKIFEGCMPVEDIAARGVDTLSFGPMKPVGLIDPKTGKMPYAVVQMRQENISKSMYNLVGFQTRMKFDEQKRVFRMIPGLENAEFYKYGVMHKNTFINYPSLADYKTYSLKNYPNIYFAGQITGVEGYIESAASGFFTAYALWAKLNNKIDILFPENTLIGALQKYTLTPSKNYQPMAANFGLIDRPVFNERGKPLKKKDKKNKLSQESLETMKDFAENIVKSIAF